MAQTGSHATLDLVYVHKNGRRFQCNKEATTVSLLTEVGFASAIMGKTVPFMPSNTGAVFTVS